MGWRRSPATPKGSPACSSPPPPPCRSRSRCCFCSKEKPLQNRRGGERGVEPRGGIRMRRMRHRAFIRIHDVIQPAPPVPAVVRVACDRFDPGFAFVSILPHVHEGAERREGAGAERRTLVLPRSSPHRRSPPFHQHYRLRRQRRGYRHCAGRGFPACSAGPAARSARSAKDFPPAASPTARTSSNSLQSIYRPASGLTNYVDRRRAHRQYQHHRRHLVTLRLRVRARSSSRPAGRASPIATSSRCRSAATICSSISDQYRSL